MLFIKLKFFYILIVNYEVVTSFDKCFSASINMSMYFFFFSLLWWVGYIDLTSLAYLEKNPLGNGV